MKKIIIISLFAAFAFGANAQSLDSLKAMALRNSSSVITAQRNVQKAEHQKKAAFTNYFPQVSAIGFAFTLSEDLVDISVNPAEYIPQSALPSLSQMLPPEALGELSQPIEYKTLDNGIITGVTALQPIFMGGQIVNGNRLAELGVDVSKIQLEDAVANNDLQIENYYWQIVALKYKRQTIAVLDSMLKNMEKDAEAAVSAGVRQRNDLLQVRLKQNELKTASLELENGIRTLTLLLSNIVGVDADSLTVEEEITTDGFSEILLSDTLKGINGTTEYRLLQKNLEAAQIQKKMTTGKNMPTVAVGAAYCYNRLMDKDIDFGALFATVKVPISGWWSGSHEMKMKKIDIQNAEDMLADNSEKLLIRAINSFSTVETAAQKVNVSYLSVSQSAENLRLYTDFYQAGTCSMSDYLQAQSQYQNATDTFAECFCNYQKAKAEYRKNTGE